MKIEFKNPEVSVLKVNVCDVIATSERISGGGGNGEGGPTVVEAPMRDLFEEEDY